MTTRSRTHTYRNMSKRRGNEITDSSFESVQLNSRKPNGIARTLKLFSDLNRKRQKNRTGAGDTTPIANENELTE